MASNNQQQQMVNIGGLWVNKTKSGEIYLSGYLNGARLLIFKNNFKKDEKQPDYVMYVTPHLQRPPASAGDFEAEAIEDDAFSGEPPAPSENTDDIPF